MTIAAAMQAQWRADARLLALVPPARVLTGVAAGEPALPYVVLRRVADEGPRFTSHRRIDAPTWELSVWAEGYAAAAEVLAAIAARLDRRRVELADGQTLDFTRTAEAIEPAANGRWHGRGAYRVRHQQPFTA